MSCSASDTEAQRLSPRPRRVFVLGATGTIGRATVAALLARGHRVVCFVRPKSRGEADDLASLLPGAQLRFGDVTDARSLAADGFRDERFDALVSCLASRTGTARDAWAIDHRAHQLALAAARQAGVEHMVLLSAICVQKPKLAFQQAKLAFERELVESGLIYSIVRPTAFFKSLSGQVERVRQGKPFLIFGDGRLTACKPISDRDLGAFLAGSLDDESRWNRILPLGGPGDAITPREQGEMLFELVGKPPKFRSVPLGMLSAIRAVLGALGRISPKLADKAELAGIGHYYASESMLVWNAETGRYDADATPSAGSDTLREHYIRLIRDEIRDDRGDHAVF
ncbi:MAG: NAD(P)H-binding protein [Beijerinckiaceae bacterium]|jgi:divinyl chlorophyllide a 8-vinyl-reductase|nr:NAD(P)H-binding protein [Beijerinckiaceae bacterium]